MPPEHRTILNSVIIAISEGDFQVHLPAINDDTWSHIVSGTRHDHNERLEYVGDALMYLCVALELFERYPKASPAFLTVCFLGVLSS